MLLSNHNGLSRSRPCSPFYLGTPACQVGDQLPELLLLFCLQDTFARRRTKYDIAILCLHYCSDEVEAMDYTASNCFRTDYLMVIFAPT